MWPNWSPAPVCVVSDFGFEIGITEDDLEVAQRVVVRRVERRRKGELLLGSVGRAQLAGGGPLGRVEVRVLGERRRRRIGVREHAELVGGDRRLDRPGRIALDPPECRFDERARTLVRRVGNVLRRGDALQGGSAEGEVGVDSEDPSREPGGQHRVGAPGVGRDRLHRGSSIRVLQRALPVPRVVGEQRQEDRGGEQTGNGERDGSCEPPSPAERLAHQTSRVSSAIVTAAATKSQVGVEPVRLILPRASAAVGSLASWKIASSRAGAGRSRRSTGRVEADDLERRAHLLEEQDRIGQRLGVGRIVGEVADQDHGAVLDLLLLEHVRREEQPGRDACPAENH